MLPTGQIRMLDIVNAYQARSEKSHNIKIGIQLEIVAHYLVAHSIYRTHIHMCAHNCKEDLYHCIFHSL